MSGVVKEGWLRKKGNRVNIWGDRYFALRGQTLYYYLKPTDTDPKGFFTLLSLCQVSEITSDDEKKKKQYIFRISWPPPMGSQGSTSSNSHHNDVDEIDVNVGSSSSSKSSKETSNGGWFSGWFGGKNNKNTKPVPTTPPTKITPNASGNGNNSSLDNDRHIILACDTYHDAQMWVHAIDSQLLELQSKGGANTTVAARSSSNNNNRAPHGNSASDRSSARSLRQKYLPPPGVRIREVESWIRATQWDLHSVLDGIRLLKPRKGVVGTTTNNNVDEKVQQPANRSWVDKIYRVDDTTVSNDLPCLRVNTTVKYSPQQTLQYILDMSSASLSGPIKSVRVVEKLEPYLDIIHVILESMELYPTKIAPRDLCLMRYWRQNEDGSYIICIDSTVHQDCPVVNGFVRADLHAAYVISGLRR